MGYTYEYAIEDFLAMQYEACKPRYPVAGPLSGAVPWMAWREGFQAALYGVLGGYPDDVPPLNIQILKTDALPGMTRTFFTFDAEHGLKVPSYYLVPDGATEKTPAVVAVCGHSFGVRGTVGIDEEGSDYPPGADTGYQKTFALSLCRKGFVVIAPEMFGFGYLRTRRAIDTHPEEKSCMEITRQLMMSGRTTCGVRIFTCVRALAVLAAMGHADMNRIGCMGISGGGQVAAFWAAMDDRVKAAVISGYAHVFKTGIMKLNNHCIDSYFNGLLQLGELPDLLSLIAPRPMLWEVGSLDEYFPASSACEAAVPLREVYAALGASDRFDMDEFEGTHQISGAKAYDFLKKWL